MEKLEKLFEGELKKRTKEIQEENSRLSRKCNSLEEKVEELSTLVTDLKKGDLFSKYVRNINEDNLGVFLKFIFKEKDNIVSNSQTTRAPSWFLYLITYWSQRKLLLQVYDIIGITYPKSWVTSFKIPYEWNQEEIDTWFKTIHHHYVCNGAIFDNNLGFWLQECIGRTSIENMNKSYSEIPWQFVLKNPLLLEDENFDKLVKAITASDHGIYFGMIYKYQTLSDQQVEKLLTQVIKSRYVLTWNSTDNNSFIGLLPLLPNNNKLWDVMYDKELLKSNVTVPDRINKRRIQDLPSSIEKLFKMLGSKLFSKEEIDKVYNELNNIKI